MEKVERINKSIAYLKGQSIIKYQKDVADIMNFNDKNLSSALNGNEKYLTNSFLKKFSFAFPQINYRWLKEEKEQMLVQKTTLDTLVEANQNIYSVQRKKMMEDSTDLEEPEPDYNVNDTIERLVTKLVDEKLKEKDEEIKEVLAEIPVYIADKLEALKSAQEKYINKKLKDIDEDIEFLHRKSGELAKTIKKGDHLKKIN